MEFRDAYSEFIDSHSNTGAKRLADRVNTERYHAEKLFLEKVWWPTFGNFDSLYPEYEVRDYDGGFRYVDFAYLHPRFRIVIEIDGIASHWKDITPDEFADERRRQNELIIDGWTVIRFAYSDVRSAYRICQKTIQQLFGRLSGDTRGILHELSFIDREIIRLALIKGYPISVTEVSHRIGLERHSAASHMKQLVADSWLSPATGEKRTRTYRIHPKLSHLELGIDF